MLFFHCPKFSHVRSGFFPYKGIQISGLYPSNLILQRWGRLGKQGGERRGRSQRGILSVFLHSGIELMAAFLAAGPPVGVDGSAVAADDGVVVLFVRKRLPLGRRTVGGLKMAAPLLFPARPVMGSTALGTHHHIIGSMEFLPADGASVLGEIRHKLPPGFS